jgi:hypothetical protein
MPDNGFDAQRLQLFARAVGTVHVVLSEYFRHSFGEYFIKTLVGIFKSPERGQQSGFRDLGMFVISTGEFRSFLAHYLNEELNPVLLLGFTC